MKRRFGLLLSGCGAVDGSDPHESVLAILEIQRQGHDVICMALDKPQFHVADHTTFQELPGQSRSQYEESARLSYGKTLNLKDVSPKLFDAIVIPGGQGAVKNLMSNFAVFSEPRHVHPDFSSFILECNRSGGVIGTIGLAEFVVTDIFGPWPSGQDCTEIGAQEILSNESRGVAATPGALQCATLLELQEGIARLIEEILRLRMSRDKS